MTLPEIVSFNDRIDSCETEQEVDREVQKLLSKNIRVQMPAEIVAISDNKRYCTIKILSKELDNDGIIRSFPLLPNIPIQYPTETNSAYIILPSKIGDTGVIEFFDTDCSQYIKQNVVEYHYDEDYHSLSSGIYTSGFYSEQNHFVIPDTNCAIIMGTKSGTFNFKVEDNGSLTMTALSLNMIIPSTTITGNIIVTGDITSTGTISAQEVVVNTKNVNGHTHGETGSVTTPF